MIKAISTTPTPISDAADDFDQFVASVEGRLRRAFVGAVGVDEAHDATAEAMAWAWEHWAEAHTPPEDWRRYEPRLEIQMDELTDQLRNLGEAAQADVAAISAASVRDRPSTTAIDVTEAPHTGPATAPTKRSRRPSRRVLIDAAAALLVALGSLSLINRPETEQAVAVTGAQARGGERAVPTVRNRKSRSWCGRHR